MVGSDVDQVTISDCSFSNNSSPAGYGGGIATSSLSALTILSSSITNNTAVGGGGIAMFAVGAATIEDSVIDGNVATVGGGGGLLLQQQSMQQGLQTCIGAEELESPLVIRAPSGDLSAVRSRALSPVCCPCRVSFPTVSLFLVLLIFVPVPGRSR